MTTNPDGTITLRQDELDSIIELAWDRVGKYHHPGDADRLVKLWQAREGIRIPSPQACVYLEPSGNICQFSLVKDVDPPLACVGMAGCTVKVTIG